MQTRIPLTKLQSEILAEFYAITPTQVVFDKCKRNALWKAATKRESFVEMSYVERLCPALAHQIKKSYESGRNIQSAVFSECVYAQTFSNMLKLNMFVNCLDNENYIPTRIKVLLKSYNLFPRYAYGNEDKSRMLIQAGGCNGIDSALVTVIDLNIYTIEFKEPGAKTSEPDLPKYGENGVLRITSDFLQRYPQFGDMLAEQNGLNFFDVMGSNINNFSEASINVAVSNNYTKKYADVICTEDQNSILVMMPVNQVSLWAQIEGEIRPAGRNHYDVWTPNALRRFLVEKGASFVGDVVTVNKSMMLERRERGGDRKVSGYKINPIFFVYKKDCQLSGDMCSFHIGKVRQLNPTITGKMFFKTLKHSAVKSYYGF